MLSNSRICIIIFLFSVLFNACTSTKYAIKVVPQNTAIGDTLYMGAYIGKSVYLFDQAKINKQGFATFSNKPALESGMYSIGTGNEDNSFNFLISDNQPQNFSVRYNSTNIAQSLLFEGSPENTAFTGYYKNEQSKPPGYENFPMLSLYIKTHSNVEYGNEEELAQHFFDSIDFADERIARMPLLEDKLYEYFFHVLDVLDTIELKAGVDDILQKATVNIEVYNLCTTFLYDVFINSPLPDHDKLAKYIGENYILAGYTAAFDKSFIDRVMEEVNWAGMNPIGSIAPDVKLQSISGDYVRLSDINAQATVLYFYDPDCGVCRKTTPALNKLYNAYKVKGLEVYAIYLGYEADLWKPYVIKENLNWINVWSNDQPELIFNNYSLLGMPTLYLLDKDKHIIAKDISIEELEDLLENILPEN